MWYIIVYMPQDDYEKKERARQNSVLVIKKLVRGKESSRGQQPIWNTLDVMAGISGVSDM
jgi:hypothetical protein